MGMGPGQSKNTHRLPMSHTSSIDVDLYIKFVSERIKRSRKNLPELKTQHSRAPFVLVMTMMKMVSGEGG